MIEGILELSVAASSDVQIAVFITVQFGILNAPKIFSCINFIQKPITICIEKSICLKNVKLKNKNNICKVGYIATKQVLHFLSV